MSDAKTPEQQIGYHIPTQIELLQNRTRELADIVKAYSLFRRLIDEEPGDDATELQNLRLVFTVSDTSIMTNLLTATPMDLASMDKDDRISLLTMLANTHAISLKATTKEIHEISGKLLNVFNTGA